MKVFFAEYFAAASGGIATYLLSGNWWAALCVALCINFAIDAITAKRD